MKAPGLRIDPARPGNLAWTGKLGKALTMKLYRPYSVVPASQLEGEFEEKTVRVDWICHEREEAVLPYYQLIKSYSDIEYSIREKNWIEERVDNLLTGSEAETLRNYLAKSGKFGLSTFPFELEEFTVPIESGELPLFKEKYLNEAGLRGCIFLYTRDKDYDLSIPVIGVISPFRELRDIHTVSDMLREIDKQNH